MEKSKFLYGALGFLALGLASCSSDDLGVKAPEVAEVDQTRFVAIQIASPSDNIGSRAFEDGVSQESFVSRLDFFFFDAEGKPTAQPKSITKFAAGDFNDERPFESGNVTRIYTSVVPVELAQGDNLPAQVLCVVNGQESAINALSSKTLEEIRDVKQSAFTRGGNFLMTNSVYYGRNVLNGMENDRLCATPINANSQLFGTADEAKKAITDASAENADQSALVNIYVERMAAKVGLTMAADISKSYTLEDADGNPVVLNFNPEYWLMNAVDDESYLTKHYGVEVGNSIEFVPTYAQINNAINPATNPVTGEALTSWDWNDNTKHRSYWGTSPSYFDNRGFPLVSDQVWDPEADHGTDVYDPTKSNYPVSYFTYNNVVDNATSTSTSTKQAIAAAANGSFSLGTTTTGPTVSTTGYIYTRETTTPGYYIRNIQTGNPAAAVASAVILGRYKVGDATENTTFYVDRNNGNKGTFYPTAAAAKAAFAPRQLAITDADGNPLSAEEVIANTAFVVKHPDAATRANLANPNIAGRLVTLQLASVPSPALYYFDGTDTQAIEDAEDLAAANAQLVTTGYMDVFYQGLAFFSIPIRHLRWENDSYDEAKKQYLWQNMVVGELGVVRNHVYNITVNSINGLGNGLRSLNQPIVPAKDAVNQFIAMKLNILSWNVANSWTIDI